MRRGDAVMASYQKGYDEARALYDNDQLDEAVEEAEKMLADSRLPRFHRIRLYCLVAACLEDKIEAEELIERAESQWYMARGFVSQSVNDSDTEEALAELRGEIDGVKQHLRSEREAEWEQEMREWEAAEMEDSEMEMEDGGEEEIAPETVVDNGKGKEEAAPETVGDKGKGKEEAAPLHITATDPEACA